MTTTLPQTVSASCFAAVSAFLEKAAAINLAAGKEYLVESRLRPVARDFGHDSIDALAAALSRPGEQKLRDAVVDAMTTNETFWFRDVAPWQSMQSTIIPEIVARKGAERSLNVWCGASSSGQEPFTVSMVLAEHFPELSQWTRTFVGTDISESMLARCKSGFYTQLEVNRGLPASMLVRHFDRIDGGFRLKPELQRQWTFHALNLAQTFSPRVSRPDVVLLRNVLIYFNEDTKRRVLARVRQLMHPDGWLLLGPAETMAGIDNDFERVASAGSGVFRPRGYRTGGRR
jgi:chemotaxis protein methyltransferase CheR